MPSEEKIDIFCHIIPPKCKEALFKKAVKPSYYIENTKKLLTLTDLELRFRAMDRYEGLRQVLNLGAPPLEHLLSPQDALEVARIANDEMAELVGKYPDRFVTAMAGLPYNDMDATLREAERAIEELNFRGIQIFSSVNGKPLDRPEFLPLYEKMVRYDLPILLHPLKDYMTPDYPDETASKYELFKTFAWPLETTLAMARLVMSGIMEKYPELKIVTHHCGAMLPFFAERVAKNLTPENRSGEIMELKMPPLDYFKRFYGDTNLGGNAAALMCGYDFFGADRMVFATDYPYPGGMAKGDIAVGEVIGAVARMSIRDSEKTSIFSGNARRLLKL